MLGEGDTISFFYFFGTFGLTELHIVLGCCQVFPDTVVCRVTECFPQEKILWLHTFSFLQCEFMCVEARNISFQVVFLSEILVLVRMLLYFCWLDTCRSDVSAETVTWNRRLALCLHTSKSTCPTSVLLNNTAPFLPTRPLPRLVFSRTAQSCLPPALCEVCRVSEKGELL